LYKLRTHDPGQSLASWGTWGCLIWRKKNNSFIFISWRKYRNSSVLCRRRKSPTIHQLFFR
jgi:hypothetical protein